ncbi:MAG: transcriptional regulator [Thermoplasmata archaeon]
MEESKDDGLDFYKAKLDDLAKYSEIFKRKSLKSTVRLTILLTLFINNKMTFSSLSRIMGISKGSMKNNLDILEEDGLIQSREVFTVRGPRLIYEITKEGKNVYLEISRLLTIRNK